LTWLVAIKMPEAVMKPEITGWLKKWAKNPNLNTPISSSTPPDSSARVMAICP
jgi:hypothetical protein